MRQLNLRYVVLALAVMALLSGATYGVHEIQVRRNASARPDRARRAQDDKGLEDAEQLLRKYLDLPREYGPAWKLYAQRERLVAHTGG